MPIVLVAGRIHADGLAILRARPDVELVVIEDPDAEIPMHQIQRADAF